jgi:hypothetical protein
VWAGYPGVQAHGLIARKCTTAANFLPAYFVLSQGLASLPGRPPGKPSFREVTKEIFQAISRMVTSRKGFRFRLISFV